ncbi:MAG: cysteine peptidase family C39 domain-containing protein [Candidatus Nanopelagicales bacterium]
MTAADSTAASVASLPTSPVVKVPSIVQMEEVECGAASLAMILAHYGCWVPLEELRVTCGVSRDGANALAIVKAARHYGLDASGGRFEIDELAQQKMPCIIFWRQSHFVVLEGFSGGRALINDPAAGQREIAAEEFRASYSGIGLVFDKTPNLQERPRPAIGFAGGLGRMLRRSRGALAFIIAAGILLAIPGIVASVLTSAFVDQVIGEARTPRILPALIVGFVIVTVLMFGFTALQQSAMLRLQIKISSRETTGFLMHMMRLPTSYFDARQPGAMVQKLQLNATLSQLLAGPLGTVLVNIVSMIVVGAVMFLYSPALSLIGLVMAAVNLLLLWWVSRTQVQENIRQQDAQVRQTAVAFQGISLIENIKATGSEDEFFVRWAGSQAKATNAEQTVGKLTTQVGVLPSVITIVNTVLVFTAGSALIFAGDLTVGALVAFQGLLVQFMSPLGSLVTSGDQFQSARAQLTQIEDVTMYPADPLAPPLISPSDNSVAVDRPRLSGKVELRDITFGYNPSAAPLLTNFNLVVEPGQRVAIVGASGSGKSTVGNLIVGLLAPWSGEVLLDDQPRDSWPRVLVVNSLAKVDQMIMLFDGTVTENLTLFDVSRPFDWVRQAAIDAQIHDDIVARFGGFSTHVDEGGTNFSGGQGQRLEIARALALNPSIIVLDEATSALDTIDELRLDRALRARGLTSIIIAHRLSTIMDSDLIVVLEDGKEVGRGTHSELMASCPAYSALVGQP